MKKEIFGTKKTSESKSKGGNDKYLQEYESITNNLGFVGKEEVFPQLVKLVKVCKKLQIPLPMKYSQYYFQTRTRLCSELRVLEKRVTISQINNENYTHLEEKIRGITEKLGLQT